VVAYGPKVEDHDLALEVSGESEVLPGVEPLDLQPIVPVAESAFKRSSAPGGP
jgi:hypothetical protein